MAVKPDSTRKRGGDPQIVLRAAEPEDRPRAREVQWAVGWKDAPSSHHACPEADADWHARRYYREIVAAVAGVIAGGGRSVGLGNGRARLHYDRIGPPGAGRGRVRFRQRRDWPGIDGLRLAYRAGRARNEHSLSAGACPRYRAWSSR